MRIALLLGLTVLLAACGSDDPGGTLTLKPDAFQVQVGQTTFLTAYLNDGMTDPSMAKPVEVSYSLDPEGIVMLIPYNGIQKVQGVSVGNVVVTATGFDQTAKVGFTVVSP
ncbi:MAG: hypothetical protein QM831_13560 [Kofleriaceae bacterium]